MKSHTHISNVKSTILSTTTSETFSHKTNLLSLAVLLHDFPFLVGARFENEHIFSHFITQTEEKKFISLDVKGKK